MAANVFPAFYPLEVDLSTNQLTYNRNEVVRWVVNIAGGSSYRPNFTAHFTDTKGNSYWIENLNKYSTLLGIYSISVDNRLCDMERNGQALLVFEAILSVLLFVKHSPLDAVAAKE